MCAIDLLATVAENLLFDNGSSLMSIDKPVNEDNFLSTQTTVKEEYPVEEEKPLKPLTLSEDSRSFSPFGFSSVINGKVETDAEGFSNSVGGDSCRVVDLKPAINGDAVAVDGRPNVVVSLGSSSRTEVPSVGSGSSHGVRGDVNLFSRDDDENFSGYICPRVTKKPPRTVPRIGDRRIRKILASRHWKGGSRHAG